MQLKALKIEEYSLRGISYEGGDMPKGHAQTDLSDVLIKFREREAKLRAQIAESVETQTAGRVRSTARPWKTCTGARRKTQMKTLTAFEPKHITGG